MVLDCEHVLLYKRSLFETLFETPFHEADKLAQVLALALTRVCGRKVWVNMRCMTFQAVFVASSLYLSIHLGMKSRPPVDLIYV